jgi:iron complex outermembrane recepter protein
MKRNRLYESMRLALGAAAGIGLGLMSVNVMAEEDEDGGDLDRVQVTGSRIQSAVITSSAPVAEIAAEEFRYTGTTRVEDLLNQYPQLDASVASTAFSNNPTTGYPTASLRGLGSQRTLVLINGHRLPPGGIRSGAESRDLNAVPAALVRRVDILSGGASAVYGSDAMAGVINFILDTDFSGFSVNGGYAGFQHNNNNSYMRELHESAGFDYPTGNSGLDGRSLFTDVVAGGDFAGGRGHAMGWLTYRDNDELLQDARDYSSCSLNNAGTACAGSAAAARPNFILSHPDFDGQFAHWKDDGSWAPGIGELYNFGPINHFQRPDERWTFGSSIKYDHNDNFRPYIETLFANASTAIQSAESGTFFIHNMTLPCDSPMLGSLCSDLGLSPNDPLSIAVGKRNNEGGPRRFEFETANYRAIVGATGDITTNWSYDASFMYSRNISSEVRHNDLLADKVLAAMMACNDPDLASTTACYNVWNPDGVSEETVAALSGVGIRQGANSLQVANVYASGDLGFAVPGSDVNASLVAGAEHRIENYLRNSDANLASGNFTGTGGPVTGVEGEIKVHEFFLESAVPLLADRGVLDSLALDLGYRWSDYSTSGTANTWKIGAHAHFGDIRVRGGYNRAIRAANTNELFSSQSMALFGGEDPCAGPSPALTMEQCARTGVSAAQYGNIVGNPADQYNQLIGGNPDLDPEVADTWTLGFVATPINGLQVALDYFNISMEDQISTVGAPIILEFCALTGNPLLCDNINRNPVTGDLWIGSDPESSGHVRNLFGNFGELNYSGLDLNVRYSVPFLAGHLSSSFTGTHMLKEETAPLPGILDEATYDCVGILNVSCQSPEWRHIAGVRYLANDWTAGIRWRYTGPLKYRNNDGSKATVDQLLVDRNHRLGSYSYLDVHGSWQATEQVSFTFGVNNILDKEPPLVGGTLSLNANSLGGYDQIGRYVFAQVGVSF